MKHSGVHDAETRRLRAMQYRNAVHSTTLGTMLTPWLGRIKLFRRVFASATVFSESKSDVPKLDGQKKTAVRLHRVRWHRVSNRASRQVFWKIWRRLQKDDRREGF